MFRWLRNVLAKSAPQLVAPKEIPDEIWKVVMTRYPFLESINTTDKDKLRSMCSEFLSTKEFFGAQGFEVTDEIAVCIAAQACLPVLHLGLHWYDDFVGIVVHSGEVVARREVEDENGVVHHYDEVLSGEAMERGPITLSWADVELAGESASDGYNVVIHEFAHKLDMKNGQVDGCVPLPADFMNAGSSAKARTLWLSTMQKSFDSFKEKVIIAERFSGEPPWLDAYGAESVDEFFAVSCEAYFVNREQFRKDFEELAAMYDEFFQSHSTLRRKSAFNAFCRRRAVASS